MPPYISGSPPFRDYFMHSWLARSKPRAAFRNIPEEKMNAASAEIVDVALSEGAVSFTTYFLPLADRKPARSQDLPLLRRARERQPVLRTPRAPCLPAASGLSPAKRHCGRGSD